MGTARPRGDDIVASIDVARPVCNAQSVVEILYLLQQLGASERHIRGFINGQYSYTP
jgi:hypothetical protein